MQFFKQNLPPKYEFVLYTKKKIYGTHGGEWGKGSPVRLSVFQIPQIITLCLPDTLLLPIKRQFNNF